MDNDLKRFSVFTTRKALSPWDDSTRTRCSTRRIQDTRSCGQSPPRGLWRGRRGMSRPPSPLPDTRPRPGSPARRGPGTQTPLKIAAKNRRARDSVSICEMKIIYSDSVPRCHKILMWIFKRHKLLLGSSIPRSLDIRHPRPFGRWADGRLDQLTDSLPRTSTGMSQAAVDKGPGLAL